MLSKLINQEFKMKKEMTGLVLSVFMGVFGSGAIAAEKEDTKKLKSADYGFQVDVKKIDNEKFK